MTTIAEPIFAAPPANASPTTGTLCSHCAQPVPAALIDPSADHQFCCPGCRAVYDTLHACGLDAYYHLRDAAQASTSPVRDIADSFEAFDSSTFHDLYVQRRDEATASADLVLEGVTCAACVWLLERLPRVLPGVIEARLSLRDSIVRITWDPARIPLSRIARTIARFGYVPHPARSTSARDLHRRETRRRLVHLGIAGALMGNTMLLAFALYAGDFGHMGSQYKSLFRWISAALGLTALAWPGAAFFRSAYASLRTRAINLDVPIALALAVGGAAGLVNVLLGRGEIYFDSLSVLIFLLLVGRFIQYRQQRQADDAVGLLFSLTPSTCHLVRPPNDASLSRESRTVPGPSSSSPKEEVVDVPVEALTPGDLVEVRPGELFPADGQVEAGTSAVDQALLTGESVPVRVSPGSAVHAGSQNTVAPLRVRVTQVGADTRVGKLMHLVERGVHERPPILLFADRVGRWFTAGVAAASAAVFAYWLPAAGLTRALDHTIAFLIVTCPCVLGLATPMTLALSIGHLARRDILVKSGTALEALSRGGRLLLDKTGTLTEGKLELLEWVGDESLKPAVAALESKSNHPVGRALHTSLAGDASVAALPSISHIVESNDGGISGRTNGRVLRAGSPKYMTSRCVAIPHDLGVAVARVERRGATAIVVSLDETATAVIALGDRLRSDTAPAVARLRDFGFRPAILSGDAPAVVARVADQLDFDPTAALGALSPEEKLNHVRDGASRPAAITVMVGDGVNDAAALAAADVGIAVHGGAEASLAAADVYVARPGLAPVVELVDTSRRAMRTIRRNFLVSLAYNLLAGTLAAAGVMTPMVAAIIMPVSSATVLSLAALSARRGGGGRGAASWK